MKRSALSTLALIAAAAGLGDNVERAVLEPPAPPRRKRPGSKPPAPDAPLMCSVVHTNPGTSRPVRMPSGATYAYDPKVGGLRRLDKPKGTKKQRRRLRAELKAAAARVRAAEGKS